MHKTALTCLVPFLPMWQARVKIVDRSPEVLQRAPRLFDYSTKTSLNNLSNFDHQQRKRDEEREKDKKPRVVRAVPRSLFSFHDHESQAHRAWRRLNTCTYKRAAHNAFSPPTSLSHPVLISLRCAPEAPQSAPSPGEKHPLNTG